MTKWVENASCPKCGSKDNRGIWEDGSSWCFGCHTYTPPTDSVNSLKRRLLISKTPDKKGVFLPDDAFPVIPKHALEWLGKYALTKDEVTRLNVYYSQGKDLLIFPFLDENRELLAWQGRYFGKNPDYPKYVTYGTKDMLSLFPCGEKTNTVSVVEDVISAVKVSRVTDTLALLGSHLSLKTALRLSRLYPHMVLWLDADKYAEALRMATQYSPMFESVRVIRTDQDPKCYNTDEIKKQLDNLCGCDKWRYDAKGTARCCGDH